MSFAKVNDQLIHFDEIKKVELSELMTETIIVYCKDGSEHTVTGFAALELVWLLKPSALEGKQYIKWKKHYWAIHNLLAHPIMQLLAFARLYKQAIFVHEVTVPKPVGYKNKQNNNIDQ